MVVQVVIDPDVHLPCYWHLENTEGIDIDLTWGSRDSGKSREWAMRLVEKCLTAQYFRCILARKTFNTIRDSQWQLIKDIVEDWGLQDFFDFNKTTLEITCANGNKFLARGFDNAQRIKSIQNPSNAWVEEGNELTEDDWIILTTSLRSNDVKTHIVVTFNPECDGDFNNFWLFKNYLKKHYPDNLSFTDTIETEMLIRGKMEVVKTTYRSTHTTYRDNPYCSPQRIAVYEGLRLTSPYHWLMYACGMWGKRENKSPFILTFSRQKHVVPRLERDFTLPVVLCFDFNRNPMCVSVVQVSGLKVRWLEVIKQPNTTIYQVCDIIKLKYPNALFIVCGDWTGINRSALVKNQDMDNYYKVIQQELRLTKGQMQYEQNPPIEENQVLVNHCLQHLDVLMDERTCQPLIFDYENAEVLPDGKLKKLDREDPTQQLDALDTARYLFNKFYKHLNPLMRKKAA